MSKLILVVIEAKNGREMQTQMVKNDALSSEILPHDKNDFDQWPAGADDAKSTPRQWPLLGRNRDRQDGPRWEWYDPLLIWDARGDEQKESFVQRRAERGIVRVQATRGGQRGWISALQEATRVTTAALTWLAARMAQVYLSRFQPNPSKAGGPASSTPIARHARWEREADLETDLEGS
ncbi:MAG: hypothetical protein M1840_003147 [Geoglossum simile]|nr:MAG: hypothetical protein M1840_003147 [Geoglossum simile]